MPCLLGISGRSALFWGACNNSGSGEVGEGTGRSGGGWNGGWDVIC